MVGKSPYSTSPIAMNAHWNLITLTYHLTLHNYNILTVLNPGVMPHLDL